MKLLTNRFGVIFLLSAIVVIALVVWSSIRDTAVERRYRNWYNQQQGLYLTAVEESVLKRLARECSDQQSFETEANKYASNLRKVRDANAALESWQPKDYAKMVKKSQPQTVKPIPGLPPSKDNEVMGMKFRRPDLPEEGTAQKSPD